MYSHDRRPLDLAAAGEAISTKGDWEKLVSLITAFCASALLFRLMMVSA